MCRASDFRLHDDPDLKVFILVGGTGYIANYMSVLYLFVNLIFPLLYLGLDFPSDHSIF